MSFLDLSLRPSRESNERFLGAASAISRPEIISIAGKNFLYQNKSEKNVCSAHALEMQYFSRLLVDKDRYCGLFLRTT